MSAGSRLLHPVGGAGEAHHARGRNAAHGRGPGGGLLAIHLSSMFRSLQVKTAASPPIAKRLTIAGAASPAAPPAGLPGARAAAAGAAWAARGRAPCARRGRPKRFGESKGVMVCYIFFLLPHLNSQTTFSFFVFFSCWPLCEWIPRPFRYQYKTLHLCNHTGINHH